MPRNVRRKSSAADPVSGTGASVIIRSRNASIATAVLFGHHL
jgi:hypothetical protein